MQKPVVFIHTNANQFVGAKVAEYALRKKSRHNDQFDVRILHLDDYPHLTKREGQTYLRKGTVVTWRNEDLQSFSPLRFLPPHLMGFQGRALVIDPDIFAMADVHELLTRDMQGKPICCRMLPAADGRPTVYASSVMLLDCARLTHWNWYQKIDEMFAHQWDYGQWIFLRTEKPEDIGLLEPEWNDFDTLTEKTKLLHNTERSTQPWKTGLPVDYNLNYGPAGPKWGVIPRSWVRWAKARLGRGPKYQPHPDRNQEQLFFGLVRECLKKKVFTTKFLRAEIRKGHLRSDALSLAESL